MQDAPYGYCRCGCGEKTTPYLTTERGHVAGESRLFLPGHHTRAAAPRPGSPEYDARFWSKVDKTGQCWEWRGYLDPEGYGVVKTVGKPCRAHRIAYEITIGPIPQGLVIDHLCENRGCVNPSHLEPVYSGVNTVRGRSPWAINAKKTHCVNGHPFSGDNLYLSPEGFRYCRACGAASQRRTTARRRAA